MGTWERIKNYASHPDTVRTKALGASGTEQSQIHQNPSNGEKFQLLSLTGPAVKRDDIFQVDILVFHITSFQKPQWHSPDLLVKTWTST